MLILLLDGVDSASVCAAAYSSTFFVNQRANVSSLSELITAAPVSPRASAASSPPLAAGVVVAIFGGGTRLSPISLFSGLRLPPPPRPRGLDGGCSSRRASAVQGLVPALS